MTTTFGTAPAAVDVLPDFSVKQPKLPRQRRRDRVTEEATAAVVEQQPQVVEDITIAQRPAPRQQQLTTALVPAEQLVLAIAQALPATSPMAVVSIGLDNFRNVNAAFGPEAGDAALARVGQLLAWAFAPAPVARMTGDTFAVLVPHAGTRELEHRVRRALSLLASSDLSQDGLGIRTTASAGMTVLDRPGLTARGLLHEADLAMSAAKAAGRNRCVVHDAMATTSAATMQAWARQIREALEKDAFALHAQPVQPVNSDTQQWELLLRLPAADGELLPPAQFLPVAERFGLAAEVDRWVTKRAVGLIASWASMGQQITLEVNIGAATLERQRLRDDGRERDSRRWHRPAQPRLRGQRPHRRCADGRRPRPRRAAEEPRLPLRP